MERVEIRPVYVNYFPSTSHRLNTLSLSMQMQELEDTFLDNYYDTMTSIPSDLLPKIIQYIDMHVETLLIPTQRTPESKKGIREQFKHIETVEELFETLKGYVSWFNYEFIVKLVRVFLRDNRQLVRKWSAYTEKLKDYFINGGGIAIVDYEEVGLPAESANADFQPGDKVMVALVDRDDYTPTDLFFFYKAIPATLKVPNMKLRFCSLHNYLEGPNPNYSQLLDEGPNPNYSQLLDEAMKKGHIVVKWSKFSLSGPPHSGKSALLKLLQNEDPPTEHQSTPVATEPQIRITNTIGLMAGKEEKKRWRTFTTDEIKAMITQQVKRHEVHIDSSKSVLEDSHSIIEDKKQTSSSKSLEPHIEDSEVKDDLINASTVTEIRKEMSRKTTDNSPTLSEVHFIYGVDSGGQAAFLDITPALIRYNSVNILTHRLDESLHHIPHFIFSDNGKQVGKSIQRSITHFQLLQTAIRSSTSINPPNLKCDFTVTNGGKPMFMILGTFLDKMIKKMESFKDQMESLEDKNKYLWSHFESYVTDQVLMAYKVCHNDIIYPVNTIDQGKETMALANEIQAQIQNNYISAKIPANWFIFQLELEAYQKEHGDTSIINMEECIRIGETIDMNEREIKGALSYYNDLTIFLYFPQVLPHVVFLHPQPLFNMLTELIKYLTDIPDKLIPSSSHLKLKKEGKFEIKLLNDLQLPFFSSFTITDFLSLMEFLLVIAPLPDEGQYFLPCVLPTCKSHELKEMTKPFECECDPLILNWRDANDDNQILPLGLFPALIVQFLKEQQFLKERQFYLVKGRQPYRNAIQLYFPGIVQILLVDAVKYLIVYCDQNDECAKMRSFIREKISLIIQKFNYCQNLTLKDSFPCTLTRGCICTPNEKHTRLCCSSGCPTVPITERQQCWFNDFNAGSSISSFDRAKDESLDIKQLDCVCEVLEDFPIQKWLTLGLKLGLYEPTLKAIESNYKGDIEACLRECMAAWLRRQDDVDIPTWQALANALEEIDRATANKIIKRTRCRHLYAEDKTQKQIEIPERDKRKRVTGPTESPPPKTKHFKLQN